MSYVSAYCREKDRLLRGLHAGAPGDGGLEYFVISPVALVTVRPDTALEFDVDARAPRCLLHLVDPLLLPRETMPGLPVS